MPLIRWTALGVALALLGGSDQDTSRHREPPTLVPHSDLDGTWEILSVQRNGEADPVQVGAHLTFGNGEVMFQPNVRQIINDGTS